MICQYCCKYSEDKESHKTVLSLEGGVLIAKCTILPYGCIPYVTMEVGIDTGIPDELEETESDVCGRGQGPCKTSSKCPSPPEEGKIRKWMRMFCRTLWAPAWLSVRERSHVIATLHLRRAVRVDSACQRKKLAPSGGPGEAVSGESAWPTHRTDAAALCGAVQPEGLALPCQLAKGHGGVWHESSDCEILSKWPTGRTDLRAGKADTNV